MIRWGSGGAGIGVSLLSHPAMQAQVLGPAIDVAVGQFSERDADRVHLPAVFPVRDTRVEKVSSASEQKELVVLGGGPHRGDEDVGPVLL